MNRTAHHWLALLLLSAACRHSPTTSPPVADPGVPLVAVLPFAPGGDGDEQQALARAMAIEIVQWLQQSDDLTVLDAATVLALEEDPEDAAETARRLGADALVTGETDLRGAQVAIRARLHRTNAPSPARDWSFARQVPLGKTAALQAEMALTLASALDGTLLPAAERRARQAADLTIPQDAYRAYLVGTYAGEEGSPENQAALARAVALAPDFAAAWAVLADYRTYWACHDLAPREKSHADAKNAVDRALTLDRDSPLAHAAAGHLAWECDWDWKAGERHLRQALALAPGFTWARHLYAGGLLPAASRADEAVTVARPLARQSPTYYVSDYVFRLMEAGRAEAAQDVLKENRRRLPDWDDAYVVRGILWREGRYDAVLARLPEDLDGAPAGLLGFIGWLCARTGDAERAREVLRRLRAQGPEVPPMEVARVLVGLGDEAAALEALTEAFERHSGRLVHLGHEREWDPLRDAPRFQAIARAVGIPR